MFLCFTGEEDCNTQIGLHVNQHIPKRTVETKQEQTTALFGSPLICSMVQGYRVSYCKNLNKSEDKENNNPDRAA